jgi:hypothetical protein
MISGRVTHEVESRLERMALEMSKRAGGTHITPSACLAAVVERGLQSLESEFELPALKASKPAKPKATAA